MNSQVTQTVDVEAIMKEIRQRIAERGDTEIILDFDGDSIQTECVANDTYEKNIDSMLHKHVHLANHYHNINYYQMIPKGGIKSFIKRFIRKLISPTVLPLRNVQNTFNWEVVQALMELETVVQPERSLMDKQEKIIEEMSMKIQKLEMRIEKLEKK